MIERYILSDTLWDTAEQLVANSKIYEYSHRKLEANKVGYLGEVVAEHWFKKNGVFFADERENTTHDYRVAKGVTLDVKTKDRTVRPLQHYDCSVPLYNHEHQQPDFYLFISLRRNRNDNSTEISRFKEAYVLGGATQHMINSLAVTKKMGEVDLANGTKFWTSCRNIQIGQLIRPRKLAEAWAT